MLNRFEVNSRYKDGQERAGLDFGLWQRENSPVEGSGSLVEDESRVVGFEAGQEIARGLQLC